MSTNSRIGILNKDGTVRSIYCHWDGHVDSAGETLFQSYRTAERVNELIDLGSLSVLGHSVGVKHDFNQSGLMNVCTAYGRDRGEKDQEAVDHTDIKDFLKYSEEFNYLFEDGTWRVTASSFRDDEFHELTEEFVKTGHKKARGDYDEDDEY